MTDKPYGYYVAGSLRHRPMVVDSASYADYLERQRGRQVWNLYICTEYRLADQTLLLTDPCKEKLTHLMSHSMIIKRERIHAFYTQALASDPATALQRTAEIFGLDQETVTTVIKDFE